MLNSASSCKPSNCSPSSCQRTQRRPGWSSRQRGGGAPVPSSAAGRARSVPGSPAVRVPLQQRQPLVVERPMQPGEHAAAHSAMLHAEVQRLCREKAILQHTYEQQLGSLRQQVSDSQAKASNVVHTMAHTENKLEESIAKLKKEADIEKEELRKQMSMLRVKLRQTTLKHQESTSRLEDAKKDKEELIKALKSIKPSTYIANEDVSIDALAILQNGGGAGGESSESPPSSGSCSGGQLANLEKPEAATVGPNGDSDAEDVNDEDEEGGEDVVGEDEVSPPPAAAATSPSSPPVVGAGSENEDVTVTCAAVEDTTRRDPIEKKKTFVLSVDSADGPASALEAFLTEHAKAGSGHIG
eukprot:GHVU01221639.1.p1 GENE.GHVU01221639.1~~GHVU01221639.1.p1  ORF type:complete len:356 (-),score=68.32 GHVU01221639.1:81-1148(-)